MRKFVNYLPAVLVLLLILTGCLGVEPGKDTHRLNCLVCDTLGDPIKGIELAVDSRTLANWDKPGDILSEITSSAGTVEWVFSELTDSKVYIFTARDINPLENGSYKDLTDTLVLYFNSGTDIALNLTFCMEKLD